MANYNEIIKPHKSLDLYISDLMSFYNSDINDIYEYCLINAIICNLYNVNGNLEVSFKHLISNMSKTLWNLIVKNELMIDKNKLLDNSINEIITKNPEYNKADYSMLSDVSKKQFQASIAKIFNNIIESLFNSTSNIFGYDSQKEKLWFDEQSYTFLLKHKCAIEMMNNYSWIMWCSKYNNNNVIKIFDNSEKIMDFDEYKRILLEYKIKPICLYCDKELNDDLIIDHFIPYEFVKDNQVWNMSFICEKCFNEKGNKLPSRLFLDKIIKRNRFIFANSHEENLESLYKSALDNGYKEWI